LLLTFCDLFKSIHRKRFDFTGWRDPHLLES
jgi:hypothetical protein